MKPLLTIPLLFLILSVTAKADPVSLQAFHTKWRTFERPPQLNGAPDYRQQTFDKRMVDFNNLKAELNAIDTTNWAIADKIDWMILWAEMNGFDFNYRVLRPWQRDPAFYKTFWTYRSDVPGHEGPTHHATVEIWQYKFPLSKTDRDKLIEELQVIVPLNNQAKMNLTGNAKELWITGIGHIEQQSTDLRTLLDEEGVAIDKKLVKVINDAMSSTDDLVDWLNKEALNKTGASGIGKENYSWYQQNVHLVPLTWEDEVMILKRELARAWSSLKLEEHRNRHLPPLPLVENSEKFDELADQSAKSLIEFLKNQDIVTVKDYFEPALREHLGSFIPEDKRNFFTITMHYDPRPLYTHFYHWFELAREDNEPSGNAIRQGPLLYNIFDSRNEGTATAVEEMFMQAGLYDDLPRVREIVYIMIAQRAARGLGSLYAHANEMTMEEAGGIHSEYTPRGWMKTEKELLIFEQHLYMRQPGYGTSYITGKHLLEDAMAEFARMKELANEPFQVKDFFDQLNGIGSIPISLGKWEMTGISDIDKFLKK
ncbi:MAG: hypothetical protein JXR10_05285 [Cyclobacteriaceae bacterium]